MTAPDLYATLGLRKTASAKAITKAFRRKVLEHHPDRNPGDETARAKFEAIQAAYDVLSDPARRARYDATGQIDGIDNELAAIMGVIVAAFHPAIGGLAQQGKKPEHHNLVAVLVEAIEAQCQQDLKTKAQIQETRKVLMPLAGRFQTDEPDNLMEQLVQGQLATLDGVAKKVDASLALRKKAIAFLKKYRFRFDKQVVEGTFTARAGTSTASMGGVFIQLG